MKILIDMKIRRVYVNVANRSLSLGPAISAYAIPHRDRLP